MQLKRKSGDVTNSNDALQKILLNLRDARRRTGGGTTSSEILEKVQQSPHDKSAVEEKKVNNHTVSKEVKKTLKELLQSLHDESEEEENKEEKEIDNSTPSEEDIEREIYLKMLHSIEKTILLAT